MMDEVNGRGIPPLTQVGLVERPSEIGGARYSAIKPETMASILNRAAEGELEDWFDLVDKMVESDAHLASLLETRTRLLVGSPYTLEPGATKPGEEQLAIEAAHLCEEHLQSVDDVERLFADLNQGVFSGLSAQEHNWEWEGGQWVSHPEWRAPRLFRFGREWQVQVRDRDRAWVDIPHGKFIVHMPRAKTGYPSRAAILRDVAWEWLFKFWAVYFWTSGAERLGNPPMVGSVGPTTGRSVREKLERNLERLSSGQAAVLEDGTEISFPDPGFTGSANVWEQLVKNFDAAESKRIVGSTLNIEVGETGGAYAAADSQAVVTIRPRILSDGYLLGGTIARGWCARILEYNAHLFGGRIPPTPAPVWSPDVGEPKASDALVNQLVATGAVRRDELRALAGLPGLGGVEGNAMVSPLAKAPGAAGAPLSASVDEDAVEPVHGGAGPERPLSRRQQLTLPLTAPTSSHSREKTSPLANALLGTLDGRPSSP